ncbi:MAG: cation:proton antiporter, partial [Candidatus Thermoplasmatota archaeon]
MVQLGLFLDLFLVALGALAGGWVCKRLAIPEVLGYLGAGIILGPTTHHGAAFVDGDTIRAIGQFAVVFRMFLMGLDFDPRRLRGRWRPALTAGVLEMGLATAAGLVLAWALGWPLIEGAVLGAAMGTTSTSILAKALADRGMSSREDARAAGAATLAEDLLAMLMLAVLTVFGTADPAGGTTAIFEDAAWLLLFASLAFTAGAIFVPVGLDRLGRSKSDELLTLAVIGILFAFATLSIGLGAGPALGAFLAGIAVGAARHAPGVGARVLPMRDMLVPVAYVGIGLILDAGAIVRVIPLAILIAIVFVAIKWVAVTIGLRLGGVPTVTAARAGAILGQAGTMGLVVACGQAFKLPHISTLIAIAFVAWAFTVALTPLRLKHAPDLADKVMRALGASDRVARSGHLPFQPDITLRTSLYSLTLAMGCSLALTAIAALAAKGDAIALSGLSQDAATGIAAALAGFAA